MRKNVFFHFSLLLAFLFFLSSCSSSTSRYAQKPRPKVEKYNTKTGKNLRSNIVKDAKKYVGSKYRYGGKTPAAFDCSGLTSYVLNRHGFSIPAGSRNQSSIGTKVAAKRSKPGDLIFFGNKGNVNHVGIVIENGKKGIYVIHSTSSRGVVIDNVNASKYWNDRLMYSRNLID